MSSNLTALRQDSLKVFESLHQKNVRENSLLSASYFGSACDYWHIVGVIFWMLHFCHIGLNFVVIAVTFHHFHHFVLIVDDYWFDSVMAGCWTCDR